MPRKKLWKHIQREKWIKHRQSIWKGIRIYLSQKEVNSIEPLLRTHNNANEKFFNWNGRVFIDLAGKFGGVQGKNSVCYNLERLDGSHIDIGLGPSCFDGKDPDNERLSKICCRNHIADPLYEMKVALVGLENAHLYIMHHDHPDFDLMFKKWAEVMKIDFEKIEIDRDLHFFKCQDIVDSWVAFHDKFAKVRLVTLEEHYQIHYGGKT